MSYLVIKSASNATPESYQLTNTYVNPKLAIKNSYLPLTTNTLQGQQLKVKVNNVSYRAMVTSTSSYSQSASATYLTSNVNSQGLSNTTALTRVQTTGVEYLTSQKTTDTIYETASTSVSTVYISSTQKKTSWQETAFVTFTSILRYTMQYTSISGSTTQKMGNTTVSVTSILQTWMSLYNEITTSSPSLVRDSTITNFRTSYTGGRFVVTSPHDVYISANTRLIQSLIEDPPVFITNVTTNTVYKTSIDTYDTIYLTSEMTTGYSGISSSSSSESASGTCWK